MFEHLSSYKGKRIAVELANGKQLLGTVIDVTPQNIRMETDEGTCVILMSAIQIVWDQTSAALNEKDMKAIALQSIAAQDQKSQADLEQTRPCLIAFSQPSQPCTQMFGQQPCYQQYGQQPCYQQYGQQPCTQMFGQQPCYQQYGQRPQPYDGVQSEPYGDPRYNRWNGGRYGRPCFALFGGGYPPYPYQPYPYPPYPYPPYPYQPYPFPYTDQANEQTTNDTAGHQDATHK